LRFPPAGVTVPQIDEATCFRPHTVAAGTRLLQRTQVVFSSKRGTNAGSFQRGAGRAVPMAVIPGGTGAAQNPTCRAQPRSSAPTRRAGAHELIVGAQIRYTLFSRPRRIEFPGRRSGLRRPAAFRRPGSRRPLNPGRAPPCVFFRPDFGRQPHSASDLDDCHRPAPDKKTGKTNEARPDSFHVPPPLAGWRRRGLPPLARHPSCQPLAVRLPMEAPDGRSGPPPSGIVFAVPVCSCRSSLFPLE